MTYPAPKRNTGREKRNMGTADLAKTAGMKRGMETMKEAVGARSRRLPHPEQRSRQPSQRRCLPDARGTLNASTAERCASNWCAPSATDRARGTTHQGAPPPGAREGEDPTTLGRR